MDAEVEKLKRHEPSQGRSLLFASCVTALVLIVLLMLVVALPNARQKSANRQISSSAATTPSSSSSESTESVKLVNKSKFNYCFDPDVDVYYRMNRSFCDGGDLKITKQIFDNRRMSSLVWCYDKENNETF